MRRVLSIVGLAILSATCSGPSSQQTPSAAATPPAPKLGIRPAGDTEIQPDLERIPPDLKKVYDYIDQNIDTHVENLQKWIRQPSISNSGEGIPETAEMVKGYFEQLGCQGAKVYDTGMGEWGSPGNPVVYARCDEGAPRTVIIYWMYDTMPITQPSAWTSPPFEARIVEQAPFKKVLIGRGATNSKGPQMAEWNAFMSMRAVNGKLPVNLILLAEGDEERMSIGLRNFVKQHADLLKDADAMYMFGNQSYSGAGTITGSSEGCINFELTTSGKRWGRGPVDSDIHGINKRTTDSPALRHIQMLATLTSPDGNHVLVPGFYDNIEPLSKVELDRLKEQARKIEESGGLKKAAENVGVARFITDDPFEFLKMARYTPMFNLDGIFGGNMYQGGAGAILPNRITSKHHVRYVPNQSGTEIAKRFREYLDKKGYADVEMKIIGDVPWSKSRYDNDLARALTTTYDIFKIPYTTPPTGETNLAGFWPAYLFSDAAVGYKVAPVRMPIIGGGAGFGGNAHAANEYYIIEGAGKVYGMAGAEKSIATFLYAFAGKLLPAPAKTN
jgi:acetylornithine deacetylase/succinyl-diaminopimelate desuccinylase-like protein